VMGRRGSTAAGSYEVTAAASTSAAMAAGAVDRSKTGHTWSNTE
jgi:hypothetical protein